MTSLILLVFALVIAIISASNWIAEEKRVRILAVALSFFFAALIFGNQTLASLFGGGH
jgi:hypothetical protein